MNFFAVIEQINETITYADARKWFYFCFVNFSSCFPLVLFPFSYCFIRCSDFSSAKRVYVQRVDFPLHAYKHVLFKDQKAFLRRGHFWNGSFEQHWFDWKQWLLHFIFFSPITWQQTKFHKDEVAIITSNRLAVLDAIPISWNVVQFCEIIKWKEKMIKQRKCHRQFSTLILILRMKRV